MTIINSQIDQFTNAVVPATFGELMEIVHIVSTKLQMLQGTSHAESSHMRLASRKP
jgi:hypothetical protein